MKKIALCFAFSVYTVVSYAQNGIVKTIAGNGTGGYTGDGGPATAAMINTVGTSGVAVDNAGNVYIADAQDHVVRKISNTGIITTIAGTGTSGFTGDGGPATAAKLYSPGDVATDNTGNIYISDGNNFRIRKITPAGIISTLAGNGTAGSSGDGGPATAAAIWPARVNTDNAGNVYVVDGVHACIRKINTAGIITTITGTGVPGFSGDGGPATAAQINGPGGVAVDGTGNVYVADGGNYRIRKINTAGIISTYAGMGISGYSGDGGPALSAEFTGIYRLDADHLGNLYLADKDNYRIRKISAAGIITTVAGTGSLGCGGIDNIPAITSPTRDPLGVCADAAGRIYYIDNYCMRVRTVTNPADIVADSFSVYITNLCAGPDITVLAAHATSGLSVKAYFGDGTSTTTTLTGITAHLTHTYQYPGNYTMKYVLYNGATAIDSAKHTYEYLFCNSLPISFYYDGNNNCTKDSTAEQYINQPVLTAVDSNGVTIDTISAMSGLYYNAYGTTGDVYTFRVLSYPAGLLFSCSGTGIVHDTLTTSAYSAATKYVGFSCSTSTAYDLKEITAIKSGRHYQEGTIMLYNDFCTPQTATVTLNFSPKYVFDYGAPLPTSVSGHTATWVLPGVASFNANLMNIRYGLTVPGTWLTPGDTVMSNINVTPTTGDIVISNNNENRNDTVKSSFDPNEISVLPQGLITPSTQLKYTITFENTGNDTAHNIYVMDTLSDNVLPSSLRIVAASATMKTSTLKAGGHNIIRFDFPNINLLDSSHHGLCYGSVIYTINVKPGLAPGTTIDNEAGIYFDDNDVVMTNMVENVIGSPTGISGISHNAAALYPNPAGNEITFRTSGADYTSFTISNNIGQTLIQQPISSQQTSVDIQALPSGVYYVTFKGENGVRVQKFVKM